MLIENATEINRLTRRIHEMVKRRSESEALRLEWSEACEEFHARYSQLCLPGGPYSDFYERIRTGDIAMIEVALCFLEVRPYFFRSGYHWKTIQQKCKRAPMSGEQADRFATIRKKYIEWKRLRDLSSKRGAIVRRDLWPLLRRFHHLFPVKFSDGKFDGLVTVGDLYNLLCATLKIEPDSEPARKKGVVREPCRAKPQADMSIWAEEFGAWRRSAWTPEDVWATLVSIIIEVYCVDASFVVGPETILREPTGQ
jgi:hypothetical protein